jgi:hypothetical protein
MTAGAAPAAAEPAPPAEPEPAGDLSSALPTPTRPMVYHGRGSGWVIALLVIPLISYSVLSTVAVLILYFRPQPPHPLEMMPDVEGDYPGGTKKLKVGSYERPRPDEGLPPQLRVALGHSLTLGDLEVTPQSVQVCKIRYRTEGRDRSEESPEPTLVLRLRLKNVGHDVAFYPTDPYFDRRWTGNKDLKPYTYLDTGPGGKKFYGGAVAWKPRKVGRMADPREIVEGQNHGRDLGPGQEMDTFVCTAPEEHVPDYLEKHDGPLLWRVHLRRGRVAVGDHEKSATAVVGVEFTRQDIRHGG